MLRKIFAAWLLVTTFLFAQIVSAAELDAIKNLSAKYYANGKEIARHFAELRTYSDHGTHHAALVAIKSLEAADALDRATLDNPWYSSIDRRELEIAAFMHDTGMDGGNFKTYTDGNALRKDHSLNSAIHVLENREAIAGMGVNVDAVALDCMGHSKSCSGVRDLTSHEQWTDCFNRIDAAVELYNKKFPAAPIYFDKSTWTTGETFQKPSEKNPKQLVDVYKFNRETLARSAAVIAALRIGDANREAAQFPYTQTGEMIKVDFDSYVTPAKDWRAEISKAKIFLVDENGTRTSLLTRGVDTNGFGRMYMAGEGNLSMSCEFNPKTGNIREVFKIFHGKSFPLSTQECIEERLGELDTMKKFPVEAHVKILGDYSKVDKKKISRVYERYCRDARRKHQFPVTFEFEKE
ncbi:MAG: HD domain-containing protein [Selenomonadaceae bacterium]|nr:HD domain-containing protein [Selenomonadaceae bacterium]